MARHLRRLCVLALAVIVIAACSFAAGPSPTPASEPVGRGSPTAGAPLERPATAAPGATVAPPTTTPPPAPTPEATKTTAPTATPPAPTATPSPQVALDNLCTVALAARPPLSLTGAGRSELELQAEAMIPAARADLAALGGLPRYMITVTIDMQGPTLFGRQTLFLTNTENAPLNELYFGLFPNAPFNGARLEVSGVTVDGRPATTSLSAQDTALRVALPQPLAPSASLSVQMAFTTTVPRSMPNGYGAILYSNNLLTLASWYPILLVYDAEGWHADLGPSFGDLVFSDSALYQVTVTSPLDLVVVATGLPSAGASTTTAKTATYRAGPVRDFYLTASTGYCVASLQTGDTLVNSYYLAGSEAAGRRAAQVAAGTIAAHNEMVGLYPFREFDLAPGPLQGGVAGVEYPGVVAIGERLYRANTPAAIDFVVAHETAHQWWYSVIGNDVLREPWLDEGLTDYTATLYFEKTYGRQYANSLIRQVFEGPYESAVRAGRDMPANLPVAAYGNAGTYSDMVYIKGALFFHNLRQAIGDDAFFRILREYYAAYKYGIARGQDFLRLATSIGGPAVQDIYATWIEGSRK